jgi:DegV family protein with EDD domain
MMEKIMIVTDTDASLSPQAADEYGVIQVPITIHFGEETYKDVEEIDCAKTFARIDRDGELPTTSAPSPGDFAKAYSRAFEMGADEVICFTVSSEVSATYKSALTGKEMLEDKKVTVVDTRSLSLGQGYMVIEAAELAKQGKGREEIIAGAKAIGDRSHLYAALSTLKYMAMSGRIGHLTAGMANLLNIKPILSIQDGKLDLIEKVRTKGKSWQRVIDLVVHQVGNRQIEKLSILHANAPEDAEAFKQQLCDQIQCQDPTPLYEINPGLSIHAGSGLVGVAFIVAS